MGKGKRETKNKHGQKDTSKGLAYALLAGRGPDSTWSPSTTRKSQGIAPHTARSEPKNKQATVTVKLTVKSQSLVQV